MPRTLRRMGAMAATLLVAGLAASAAAPGASAAYIHQYESSFPVTGEPLAVAVDDQSGDVYVLNSEGFLQKFNSSGTPSNFSALGSNSIFQICESSCRELAVDNSGGPNQGVIYLSEGPFAFPSVVRVYLPSGAEVSPIENFSPTFTGACGVTVDPEGNIYVVHQGEEENSLVDKYRPADWSTHPTQEPPIVATIRPIDFLNPCRAAVGPNGNVYILRGLAQEPHTELRMFEKSAFGGAGLGKHEQKSTVIFPAATGLTVDQENGDLYTDLESEITRVDSSNSPIESFSSAHTTSSFGVAINDVTKAVYVSNAETGEVSIYKKVLSPAATDVHAATRSQEVTFTGKVDPAGAGEVVSCSFEYRLATESSFTKVPCEPVPPYQEATSVSATVNGLADGAEYEYRLVAATADAGASSPIKKFVIKPPVIEGLYSSELGNTTATLDARVNPYGTATEYFFEYGLSPEYGSTAPVPIGEIAGGADGPEIVQAHLTGLQEHVVYHFRIVVRNELGTATSDDQTFNFFPPTCPNATVRQQTGSDYLPDCRAYELVTPGNAGNVIFSPGAMTPVSNYATSPSRFAYPGFAGGVTGTEPVDGLSPDIYLATRTNRGWVTTLPGWHGSETPGLGGVLGETGDLSLSLFFEWNNRNTLPALFEADGSKVGTWPPTALVLPNAEEDNGLFQPSPDFSHVAMSSSNVAFAPNGLLTAPGSAYDYDVATGTTKIISKLWNGQNIPPVDIPQVPGVDFPDEVITFPGLFNPNNPINAGIVASKYAARVNPGVSKDGSHILMSVSSEPYDQFANWPMPPVHMYMSVDDAITYDVTKGLGEFIGMTWDGSRVFFVSNEQLTAADHDNSSDLYMWSESTNELTLLSTGEGGTGQSDSCNASWTEGCNVEPVNIDGARSDTSIANETGNVAYFYSPEQLDGNQGVEGARNLYIYRDGQVHFVAVADVQRMDVSPNGGHMALITKDRLTTYDNKSFAEMYTYDPATGAIVCSSCNPTGAPPVADVEGTISGGLFMSNDGRTFFYTLDALVPKDTDKLHDVYEFTEGRPQLITSGTGSHDRNLNISGGTRSRAALSGVSADGVDLYFATFETLVPEDENGDFLKFYDARIGGGFTNSAPSQPCVAADECHGTGSSPTPPTGIVSEATLGTGGNYAGSQRPGKARKRRHHRHRGQSGAHRHRHGGRTQTNG